MGSEIKPLSELGIDKGARFSPCNRYRYSLWRIWDKSLPLVMFVGLNPSTANQSEDDPTIRSVKRISRFNGYGGFYMMNCFPFVTSDPEFLKMGFSKYHDNENEIQLIQVGKKLRMLFLLGEILKSQNFTVWIGFWKRCSPMLNALPKTKTVPLHIRFSKRETLHLLIGAIKNALFF